MSLTPEDLKSIKQLVDAGVEAGVQPIREQFSEFRNEFSDLRGEVSELRDEVGGLQKEVNGHAHVLAEFRQEFGEFRTEVYTRFDDVMSHLDGLYKRDEDRQQEYLMIRERVRQIEQKIA